MNLINTYNSIRPDWQMPVAVDCIAVPAGYDYIRIGGNGVGCVKSDKTDIS